MRVRIRLSAAITGPSHPVIVAAAEQLAEYFAGERTEFDVPLDAVGTDFQRSAWAALRGDLHTHSSWSDGGSPIEEMAFTGAEIGHEYMVLTDHSPRLTVANGLSAARLAEQLDVVAVVDGQLGDGFRLLAGIEVDILDDGGLDQTDEMLARLDDVTGA